MMNTVRDTFSSIGDRGGDIARSVGSGTAELARSVSVGTAELARRVGGGSASFARRIGPRRALLGVAVAAVAIGGSILVVRYLRARRERDRFDVEREEDLAAASRVVPTGDRTHVPGAGVRSPL